MTEYPHVPAAFINAIAEEGTKDEAVAWLQKQWNETCALRAALKPFAEAADSLDDEHKDGGDIWESAAAMTITPGDLRSAAKLVKG